VTVRTGASAGFDERHGLAATAKKKKKKTKPLLAQVSATAADAGPVTLISAPPRRARSCSVRRVFKTSAKIVYTPRWLGEHADDPAR
jgi:hypothetical protein